MLFGRYALHQAPLHVREGGRVVDLTSRQLGVLSLLVLARGKTVTKARLVRKVWPDAAVEEGSLTQAIFMTRRALGKLPGGGEYIETVPTKGYRLSSRAVSNSLQPVSALHSTGNKVDTTFE